MPPVGKPAPVIPKLVADTPAIVQGAVHGGVHVDARAGLASAAATTTTAGVDPSGTGHASRLLALAKALAGRTVTDDEAKKLLDEVPGLRQVAKLFQWAGGEGVEREAA